MHTIGPVDDLSLIEAVGEKFTSDGILASQRQGWNALEKICESIRPGQTEKEATEMASQIIKGLGSERSWHRPIVRFGKNTIKYFSEPSEPATLREEDIFFIDIGPNWKLKDFSSIEYESDIGATFSLGGNQAHRDCAEAAKKLFHWGCEHWSRSKPTGPELYAALEIEAKKLGYLFLSRSDGHRLSEFPHQKYSRKGLMEIDFTPRPFVWVLEVHLIEPGKNFGAFYEDVLH